ncbi:hypothetical protein AGMMS50230_06450 [Spirochaetia bacterium]|nr:hypothetical protein AGMMS50230_06450 [Spirochaetia bacterium]
MNRSAQGSRGQDFFDGPAGPSEGYDVFHSGKFRGGIYCGTAGTRAKLDGKGTFTFRVYGTKARCAEQRSKQDHYGKNKNFHVFHTKSWNTRLFF